MPQRLRATVAPPNCILCDGLASPPSRMGWLQAPDRQAVFVCGRCSDCSDAELEAKIVAQVSGASADAVGEPTALKALIGQPPMAAADAALPTWAARAARAWVKPLNSAAGGVTASAPDQRTRSSSSTRPR